jgi:hypothetical protein
MLTTAHGEDATFAAKSGTSVERRWTHRLVISLPVRTSNPRIGTVRALTRDISLSGAFLYVPFGKWQEGSSIEYAVQLPGILTLADPVWELCFGRVVRVEEFDSQIGIAVKLESLEVLTRPVLLTDCAL